MATSAARFRAARRGTAIPEMLRVGSIAEPQIPRASPERRTTAGIKSYEDGSRTVYGKGGRVIRNVSAANAIGPTPKTSAGKALQRMAADMAADPVARVGGKSKMGAAARLMALRGR